MAATKEVQRLKSILKRYRSLVFQMQIEAANYTDGMDCPFCSGNEGYESANDREDETVKHTRLCPTRRAEKLAAEKI